MPSRRCPHCKALSTYDSMQAAEGPGTFHGTLGFGPQKRIRLDRCRNEECRGAVAVVLNEQAQEVEVFPTLDEEPDALLPQDVATAFRQALKSLNEGIWDGCVVMCRRALEEATSELARDWDESDRAPFEKEVLYRRIQHLAERHLITPDLGAWAHEGRLAGKLGAHGIEESKHKKWNTERDASEIVEFAKWFFRYVFILPEQLRQRKADAEEKPDEPIPPEHSGEAGQETPAAAPEAQ